MALAMLRPPMHYLRDIERTDVPTSPWLSGKFSAREVN